MRPSASSASTELRFHRPTEADHARVLAAVCVAGIAPFDAVHLAVLHAGGAALEWLVTRTRCGP